MASATFNPSCHFLNSNLKEKCLMRRFDRGGFSRLMMPLSVIKKYELKCSRGRQMDVRTSALVEDVAESWDEMGINKEPSVSTMLMNFGNSFDPYCALSTPIYQTTTFKQPSATEMGVDDYTRGGNPTRDVLESQLAKLDKADRAFCFACGMAALATVTHLVKTGQEIVAGDDIYSGSDRLLSQVLPGKGIVVKRVNMTDLNEVASAIGPLTKLVWLESPTNPRQQISDIRKISEIAGGPGLGRDIAHAHGALVLVDNSLMSPVLSQPLVLGADIAMQSATKFIAGHSDVMAGVLVENAQKIAEFLSSHPRMKNVNYAGLSGHPGRSLHYSQAKGTGSVLSFATGSLVLSKHIVETTKYFKIAISYGSVTSLITMPCFMSHACIPASDREARGLTEDLVRIFVGIEDVNDLIVDLDKAIKYIPSKAFYN
ncbi:hypothetical protein GIB67_027413 [Kingdonia uniflora]|uniref:cysteine-S-conjugate beta-lyase n=1 Tax=Kingdonia uniflora TaxID=39325 RepID=A0A7J7MF70_9MAGN|nr:hypothetical protein GIB67_027413 [Kingdonia uniflora]